MNRPMIAFLVLAFAAPALAGCLADDAVPTETATIAASAAEAGAVSGASPSAAKSPYQVQAGEASEASVTLYPLEITTNAAKAPYVDEFSGTFEPTSAFPPAAASH